MQQSIFLIHIKLYNVCSFRVLQLMELITDSFPLTTHSEPVVLKRSSFILATQLLHTSSFAGANWVVNSSVNGLNVSFSDDDDVTSAAISLPQMSVNNTGGSVRLSHAAFVDDKLFPNPGQLRSLESVVIATSLSSNLLSPVFITYAKSQVCSDQHIFKRIVGFFLLGLK